MPVGPLDEATQPELDPGPRRSSRQVRLPTKLQDYVLSPRGGIPRRELSNQNLQESNDMEADASLFPGNLDGRRIFDLNYLIHQVKEVARHGKNECGWMDVDLVREERHGLRSSFEFKCRECQLIFNLKTDDYQRKDFCADVLSAAAEANVEFPSLTAILNAADIPFMSCFTYKMEKYDNSGPSNVEGLGHPEAQ
ncbi:hypothetical protein GE061_007073, partial [Apolygus lucorum]